SDAGWLLESHPRAAPHLDDRGALDRRKRLLPVDHHRSHALWLDWSGGRAARLRPVLTVPPPARGRSGSRTAKLYCRGPAHIRWRADVVGGRHLPGRPDAGAMVQPGRARSALAAPPRRDPHRVLRAGRQRAELTAVGRLPAGRARGLRALLPGRPLRALRST